MGVLATLFDKGEHLAVGAGVVAVVASIAIFGGPSLGGRGRRNPPDDQRARGAIQMMYAAWGLTLIGLAMMVVATLR